MKAILFKNAPLHIRVHAARMWLEAIGERESIGCAFTTNLCMHDETTTFAGAGGYLHPEFQSLSPAEALSEYKKLHADIEVIDLKNQIELIEQSRMNWPNEGNNFNSMRAFSAPSESVYETKAKEYVNSFNAVEKDPLMRGAEKTIATAYAMQDLRSRQNAYSYGIRSLGFSKQTIDADNMYVNAAKSYFLHRPPVVASLSLQEYMSQIDAGKEVMHIDLSNQLVVDMDIHKLRLLINNKPAQHSLVSINLSNTLIQRLDFIFPNVRDLNVSGCLNLRSVHFAYALTSVNASNCPSLDLKAWELESAIKYCNELDGKKIDCSNSGLTLKTRESLQRFISREEFNAPRAKFVPSMRCGI